jgi:hypothetical protein
MLLSLKLVKTNSRKVKRILNHADKFTIQFVLLIVLKYDIYRLIK